MFIYPYKKSIRFNPNGFSLLKKGTDNRITQADFPLASLTTFREKCRNFFPEDNHEEIRVLINTHTPMLVPLPLYEKEYEAEYLQMQFIVDDQDRIYRDRLDEYNAIYFIHSNIAEIIETLQESFSVQHYYTYLYEHILPLPSLLIYPNIFYLSLCKDLIQFILTIEKKPFLLNQLHFSSEYDILYYILNIFKQLNINAENTLLLIEGSEPAPLLELLAQYIPNIKLIGDILK